MNHPAADSDRETRIAQAIIVDCSDETEMALGWYIYLEKRLNFPFKAYWGNSTRSPAPVVEVTGMADEAECTQAMQVEIHYRDEAGEDTVTVPLANIEAIAPDPDTAEAIADWHYWLTMNG